VCVHRCNLWGYKGYRYPHFWTEGYRTPTFHDEKVKNLLSSGVYRGDLRRLNYNKTVLAGAPTRTPLGQLMTLSQTSETDEEGPHTPPSGLQTQGRLVLLLNWYPHLLDLCTNTTVGTIRNILRRKSLLKIGARNLHFKTVT